MNVRPAASVLITLAAFLLSACSSWWERKRPYEDAVERPVLQIPSTLDVPSRDPSLVVPAAGSGRVLRREELLPPERVAAGGTGTSPSLGLAEFTVSGELTEIVGATERLLSGRDDLKLLERSADGREFLLRLAGSDERSFWRRWTSSALDHPQVRRLRLAPAEGGVKVQILDGRGRPLDAGEASALLRIVRDALHDGGRG